MDFALYFCCRYAYHPGLCDTIRSELDPVSTNSSSLISGSKPAETPLKVIRLYSFHPCIADAEAYVVNNMDELKGCDLHKRVNTTISNLHKSALEDESKYADTVEVFHYYDFSDGPPYYTVQLDDIIDFGLYYDDLFGSNLVLRCKTCHTGSGHPSLDVLRYFKENIWFFDWIETTVEGVDFKNFEFVKKFSKEEFKKLKAQQRVIDYGGGKKRNMISTSSRRKKAQKNTSNSNSK
jgi:hypothetical protein